MRHSLTAAVAMLLALLAGCDFIRGARPREPVPPGIDTEETLALRADHWEPVDAFREPTALERTVANRLNTGLGREAASDESACVARETAAFFGRYRALPDEILGQWLAGYCGASELPLTTQWTEFDAPAPGANPIGDLEALWLELLKTHGSNLRFGIGSHTRGARLVVVLSVTLPQVEVHRLGPDESGVVRVEGRTLRDVDVLRGIITRGSTGVAQCSRDVSVALPEF
ncbi:MAG TPA: hypothetical protein VFV94_10000, partial [Polyangiaceae bacterium]|nr:hypothetical protein [Polyangiaceae bacterium]